MSPKDLSTSQSAGTTHPACTANSLCNIRTRTCSEMPSTKNMLVCEERLLTAIQKCCWYQRRLSITGFQQSHPASIRTPRSNTSISANSKVNIKNICCFLITRLNSPQQVRMCAPVRMCVRAHTQTHTGSHTNAKPFLKEMVKEGLRKHRWLPNTCTRSTKSVRWNYFIDCQPGIPYF